MLCGRALVCCLVLLACAFAPSCLAVDVSTVAELEQAIADAAAGDVILLEPNTYEMDVLKLTCSASGTSQNPITVKAANRGEVTIEWGEGTSGAVEGFLVSGAYWVFENLILDGKCSSDYDCEHAFHIVGNADHTVVRNCILIDFNAQIKANGQSGNFPDDVLIELNEFYDRDARMSDTRPITKIDVVGGRRWKVRGNYIHDFDKGQGDNIAYGAFLKGHSRDGVFEKNLIRCSHDWSAGSGRLQIGLSFGGGGTSTGSCEGGCPPEHVNGIMRNNIIGRCTSLCVYVNQGENTRLFNNIGYDCTGIDFRFSHTTGQARNNIVTNTIRDRDDSSHTASNNLILSDAAAFTSYFEDPAAFNFQLANDDTPDIVGAGTTLGAVSDDWCSSPRGSQQNDLGAIQYSAYEGGGAAPCESTWAAARAGILANGDGDDGDDGAAAALAGWLGDWMRA